MTTIDNSNLVELKDSGNMDDRKDNSCDTSMSSPMESSKSFQIESSLPNIENLEIQQHNNIINNNNSIYLDTTSDTSSVTTGTFATRQSMSNSTTYESLLKTQKTKDCNITVKVFEARSLIEARMRKKEAVKNNKSFKRAQNLLTEISSPNLMTFSDTTDPYCIVNLDKQKQRTRTIPKKLNPFWCEEFQMEVTDPNSAKLIITVMDEKKYSSDDHIGKIIIPINTLKDLKEREQWFPLTAPNSSKKVPQIQILFNFKPISLTDPNQPGYIEWKILFGRNLSHSLSTLPTPGSAAVSSSNSTENFGPNNSTPFINWSVRSKKGDIIIDEEGIPWQEALANGVSRELRDSIDCITFSLWRYEPKVFDDQTAAANTNHSSFKKDSKSSTASSALEQPKSPDSKSRSSSNASTNKPINLMTPPSSPPPAQQPSPTTLSVNNNNNDISLTSSSTSSISIISNSTTTTIEKEGYEQYYIGQGIVLASHLEHEKPNDHWLCLYPKQTADNRFGDIRLKLKYTEEVVLPLQSYMPLLDLLQDDNLYTIHMMGRVTKQREAVSSNLIRVFEKTNKCIFLLKALTDHEIDSTDNPDIIFRGNSLATKSVDLYMKLVGIPYLSQTIGPLIKKIYSSKKSCEIDPTKLEKGEDIKKNCKNLLSWVKKVTAAILGSINNCPGPLREVFRLIQSKVLQRYPQDEITRYTAVSGFIFLRFFCPAILAPKLFDLMPDHPGIKTTRSLILIAKTLQNLANQVEFGEYKEDFMKDMNKFVLDNMENMKTFINNLSQVPSECPPGELLSPIILEKELACLYRHLIKQRTEMAEELNERGASDKERETFDKLLKVLDHLEEEVIFASNLS
ncbi:hypothetical protein CYY_008934 [Polysphondylium violaceum]|uniref:RasGTPase-activating protein n=1 Tax=Polysphondylium violaceum TaxID=133409 RepID=A0A8J4PMF2_9MYCE|nr:hypothetical protein CYY_008934 [Polysphondylium violaceum]